MDKPAYEKIAKILRTDKDVPRIAEEALAKIVGHNSVLDKIVAENQVRMEAVLEALGLPLVCDKNCAGGIFKALMERIRQDDEKLSQMIRMKKDDDRGAFVNLLNVAKEAAHVGPGRFLKLEKARELILANPPQNILKFLGYETAQDLLHNEDIFEIFAALRFMEDKKWLNEVFFKAYENISPDDFEKREITAIVLSEKFVKAAQGFLKKKYHNLSHLKELGVIFIIPIRIDIPGEIMRDLTLALHYFHEITFYSNLFEKYAEESKKDGNGKDFFAKRFISSLRGDVTDTRPKEEDFGKKWLIVQQYLAKDDEHDWRLFYPHVNPEAMHWAKAEKDVAELSKRFGLGFDFWSGLGFVGDFFKDESGVDVLVSFNLIDTAMALFMEKDLVKYLYHHQEAMWNKIFMSFFGEKETEQMIMDNFHKGMIEL